MAYVGSDGRIDIADLLSLLHRPAWHADAACREHPEVDFFPGRGEDSKPAKATCAACLVRAECERFAYSSGERVGIWGGLSERERRTVRGDDPELGTAATLTEFRRGNPRGFVRSRAVVDRPDPVGWCASCYRIDDAGVPHVSPLYLRSPTTVGGRLAEAMLLCRWCYEHVEHNGGIPTPATLVKHFDDPRTRRRSVA